MPYEVDLQQDPDFLAWATGWGFDPVLTSSIIGQAAYAGLFGAVLLAIVWLSERALRSPWGRMMRAIRDNEVAAEAMGKDVTRRHLQVFILGSAVVGIAGAMMTTLDGQLTPGTYSPLRFTFLVWVMVIVGGSGNNWGAVLGGFLIWWLWVMVEPLGLGLMSVVTSGMSDGSWLKAHLQESAAHMRLVDDGGHPAGGPAVQPTRADTREVARRHAPACTARPTAGGQISPCPSACSDRVSDQHRPLCLCRCRRVAPQMPLRFAQRAISKAGRGSPL